MENEDMIRREVESKRAALTEKLESLEKEVVGTVKEATAAVSDTVEVIKDSVQETVATVKDTVQDTVSSVKETVTESVETVKDWFDLKGHVKHHPWFMMGGSVALGYFLGNMLKSSPAAEAIADESPRSSHSGNGHHREKRHGGSAKKAFDLGPELSKLKGLALGALLGTARDMILPVVPEGVKKPLKDVLDNITQKLGGEPVAPSGKQADRDQSEEERKPVPTYLKRFAQP